MRSNLQKAGERGERLDNLQDKTDNLATSAQGFRRGANRVRKQMWWKDMKMRICIIVGIIILLIVIIVPSGEYITGHGGKASVWTDKEMQSSLRSTRAHTRHDRDTNTTCRPPHTSRAGRTHRGEKAAMTLVCWERTVCCNRERL